MTTDDKETIDLVHFIQEMKKLLSTTPCDASKDE